MTPQNEYLDASLKQSRADEVAGLKAPQTRPKREGNFGSRSRFPHWKCHKVAGAAYRTRTCDPRITNAMLYRLS